ncbi:MAG: cytochrome c [Pseudomonadota bacterium]
MEEPEQASVLPNGRTAAEQIEFRKAEYKKLAGNFKDIRDSLKSGAPDMSLIQAKADDIEAGTKDMGDWFPAGTGPESGLKTSAKAEIWTQTEDFANKVMAFQTAAAKLAMAAASGDPESIAPAFGATGGTCKSCHDIYKAKG